MKRQRARLIGHSGALSQDEIERHVGDITWALAAIHFERQPVAYRNESRRMLERWLLGKEVDAELLEHWYGVVLQGGVDEELASVLHVWRAVGMESVQSILRSLDRLAADHMAPIASSG